MLTEVTTVALNAPLKLYEPRIRVIPKQSEESFLAGSPWQHIFDLHSRLAIEQCHFLQTQKSAPSPCHIPDSSDCFGIQVKSCLKIIL